MLVKSLAGVAFLAAVSGVNAINLVITDENSLKQAAFVVSHGMMSYYSGNETGQTPGYLPNEGAVDGYYWWEGAGVFGSLIDYWYYTGDTTYNEVATQALLWQAGPDRNYEPLNSSQTLGNDDIGYWAMSAMKAAELNFPNPPSDQPQWIPLAQTVFSNFVKRWDTQTCGGGLRWQVFLASAGYNYKNSPANGAMFNLGARLYKYTGNTTYSDWAEKVWDWSQAIGLIDPQSVVGDGTGVDQNCSSVNHQPWTYNQAAYLVGAAAMYNVTQSDEWKQRTSNLLTALVKTFARNNVITEWACQDTNSCNNDEISFKSYTMMWLAETAKIASFTEPTITPVLQASAQGAATSCSGGNDGVTCGLDWSKAWDGKSGIGEQMDALEAFNALLAKYKAGPITNFKDGGTSAVDPNAGQTVDQNPNQLGPITGADRAGAGIITFLLVSATVATPVWMLLDRNPFKP